VLDGGDTGESWSATAARLVRPRLGWERRVVRLVVALNILLGPEGTTVGLVLLGGDLRPVWGQCLEGCGPARCGCGLCVC
jgi:hypothetical protein